MNMNDVERAAVAELLEVRIDQLNSGPEQKMLMGLWHKMTANNVFYPIED